MVKYLSYMRSDALSTPPVSVPIPTLDEKGLRRRNKRSTNFGPHRGAIVRARSSNCRPVA